MTVALAYITENITIYHYFWTIEDRAFIFQRCILCDKAFPVTPKFLPWPWPFTYISENFNISYNFLTIGDRDFIFHVYIPCDDAVPSIPKYMYLTSESKTEVPRDVRNLQFRKQDKFGWDWSQH